MIKNDKDELLFAIDDKHPQADFYSLIENARTAFTPVRNTDIGAVMSTARNVFFSMMLSCYGM